MSIASSTAKGFLAVLLLCSAPTLAQDNTPPVYPAPTSVWERDAQYPPNRNILFLIDSSGSMNDRKIGDAINFAMQVAEAPIDDFNITLVTFGSRVARWAGTKDVDERTGAQVGHRGWAAMPSSNNLQAARNWISNNLDDGSTYVIPGIEHASRANSGLYDGILHDVELPAITLKELTIIIITDGEFSEPLIRVVRAIAAAQSMRQKRELPSINFGLIGIDVKTKAKNNVTTINAKMKTLSKTFGLGYLRLSYDE